MKLTTEEHLNRILARCKSLLETARKRTPGEWKTSNRSGGVYIQKTNSVVGEPQDVGRLYQCSRTKGNAAFIASCAGPAEAGWLATIAAIEGLQLIAKYGQAPHSKHDGICPYGCDTPTIAERLLEQIIAAWPEELLS